MKVHVKNPTTTVSPINTTDYIYFYEPFLYYECEDCEGRYDFLIDYELERTIIYYTALVNTLAMFPGLFLNLLHFFVLTRKELSFSNSVFFIMLSICICDILTSASSISEAMMTGPILSIDEDVLCGSNKQWWMAGVDWYSRGIQMFGRICASILALIMTFVRTASVMFPLSTRVSRLTNLRNTVVTVVILY